MRLVKKYAVILFIIHLSSCFSGGADFSKFDGKTMGTTYHIKVASKLSKDREKYLEERIKTILLVINKKMSTYIDNSEISLLNKLKPGEMMKLTPETYEVLLHSLEINSETNGAFDITVGPLVNLWGFGAKGNRRETPPTDDEVKKVKLYTGYKNIIFDLISEKIGRRHSNLYVDLAGIAKGYAVDSISRMLNDQGHNNHMVEIGGEIRVSGYKQPSTDKKWIIAVEKPKVNQRVQGRVISMTNLSIATSGDYRNFFSYKGKRYSHTIDPITGWPVSYELSSVSVLTSDCMVADAYATALMVMGAKKGLKWADKKNLKVIFHIREKDGIKEILSNAMKHYLD